MSGRAKKESKKSLLEEVENFLHYLQENDFYPDKRKRILLRYSAEKENSERVVELCLDSNYIDQKKEPHETYRINKKGLKFLEERRKMRRERDHSRAMLFLTTMLVVTTISAFFNNTELVPPLALLLIYGVIALSIWILFKSNKNIKV